MNDRTKDIKKGPDIHHILPLARQPDDEKKLQAKKMTNQKKCINKWTYLVESLKDLIQPVRKFIQPNQWKILNKNWEEIIEKLQNTAFDKINEGKLELGKDPYYNRIYQYLNNNKNIKVVLEIDRYIECKDAGSFLSERVTQFYEELYLLLEEELQKISNIS